MGIVSSMREYNWYIKLTDEEFQKLKSGLKSYFRGYLNLTIETVWYDSVINQLTCLIPESKNVMEQISVYINGFVCAIEKA